MNSKVDSATRLKRKYVKAKRIKETPAWVNECISSPHEGVNMFLSKLCEIANAPYIHIRVRSRSGKFFKMVESVGLYKDIGWPRRFHLLDKKDNNDIYYHFIDYKSSPDCISLREKFSSDHEKYAYLEKIDHGFWIPLMLNDIELGYITLTWDTAEKQKDKVLEVRRYLKSHADYIPIVYQACRNVIANRNLSIIWSEAAAISSASIEHECYDKIAEACLHMWGDDATIYIYKLTDDNRHYEIASVMGRRENEIKKQAIKKQFPIGRSIVSYLMKNNKPFISYSLAEDTEIRYRSHFENGLSSGSAIAIPISDLKDKNYSAFISVEHELKDYFDVDDLRYIKGIARIGYENLSSHISIAENRARDFDTLFTQMSHDVFEPIQALVADAEVLKYETVQASNYLHQPVNIDQFLFDTLERVTSFLEEALNLSRRVRRYLDIGVGGEATMTESSIRLYTMLNTLSDLWKKRAESQGIDLRPLYDSLKDVRVYCDESELKTTLGHLMTNAIKYSFLGRRQSQGGVTKHSRYVSIIGRKKGQMVSIEFQNYGVGILRKELNRIPERYYRGELARREGKTGTGRGLWGVKKFVESIGGRLVIDSVQQSSDVYGPYSTTVTIYLPILTEEEKNNG